MLTPTERKRKTVQSPKTKELSRLKDTAGGRT